MKGGLHGLNRWKFPLILFVLVCATVVLGWQKAPFFTSVLISRRQSFRITPGISVSSPDASIFPETHANYLLASLRNETFKSDKVDSAIEDAETKSKDFSSGTLAASLPSQQEMLTANYSVTPKGDIVQNKFKAPALDVGVEDASAKSPVQVSSRACNYARGKWVADDRRPLYSGSGCKQWLSGMWACRLNGRADFAYEKFRWQPLECDMEGFEAVKFLNRMRNKTLAFIGDSLGRQQFQSLMCMLTGGEQRDDVMNVGWEYGLVKGPHAVRPDGWAYRFPSTNTTILYYWSSCLTDLEPLNQNEPHTEYAMHLDRPPAFLRRYINRFDVLVLNTGHHWNRGKIEGNKWIMYVGGAANTDKNIADIRGAKNLTLHSIARWVNSQLQRYPNLKPFFRSMSPRHFFNGDWNTGGTCDNTSPLSKGKEVIQNKSSDLVSAEAVKGSKVKFLDITAISNLRDEGHVSRYTIRPTPGMQDCLHWCLPGIPDAWNELLFAQI